MLMTEEFQDSTFIQALECTWAYHPFGEEYAKQLVAGGVTAINETVPDVMSDFDKCVREVYKFRRMCEALSSGMVAYTAEDIEKAKRDGKVAMIIGMQHLSGPTEYYPDDLAFVDTLHKIGVRIIQLTYQRRNLVGDGCGERTDAGLSKFGVQVVEEMNKLGILIDLSHVGPKSTMDAIEISKYPVSFTHSNCRSLCDHIRNKYDEQIKALAEKDGVQGIGMFAPLLNLKRLPTLNDFLDHIEYVIKLVGVNHVGIGLDYEIPEWPPHPDLDVQRRMHEASHIGSQANWPELSVPYQTFWPGKGEYHIPGMEDESKWKMSIVRGLDGRGYSSSDIRKVLGENFMRLFRRVWSAQY